MISFNKPVFLLLLIFLPGFSPGQKIISTTSQKVGYTIPYRRTEGNTFGYGNQLLREMAKDVLREPWLVRIHVSGEVGLTIVQEGERNQLLISWRATHIGGDTVYRTFPITDVLFPSYISMNLKWANRADTSGYTEVTLTGKPLPEGDSLICVLPVAPFNPVVDTLMVRDIELFYDSLSLRRFYSRVELIHDYYASVSLLDSLQNFISGSDPGKAEMLPVNYLKAGELTMVLERINSRNFQERLLRNNYDPSGLTRKYSNMFRQSRSLIYNFMDELHNTGAIPLDGNVQRLAGYFTSRVFSYVRRSYLMDQQQGRIYSDCLDHFFDHGAFPPEENVSARLLVKMFPDARQDTVAGHISRRIYDSYKHFAQQLIDQRQYAEAFSMLENRQRFIAGNPSLRGFEPDDQLQSVAAEGICNSYLGIASSCITGHNYKMAETYLSKADQYAQEHKKYIRNDSNYRAVFSELFFLRNADCDQLLDQKKYAEALDCYRQFENGYSKRDLALVSDRLDEKESLARAGLGNLSAMRTEDALTHNDSDTALFYYERAKALRHELKTEEPVDIRLDSLAPLMAHIKFEQIFREGSIALEKRQFTLAVNRLKDAKTLAFNYGFDQGRTFDSLNRQAMKNYLIVQLSASRKKIWASQFDSAQLAIQRTEAAGFDYGLLNDPDLLSALDKFREKIREQQCRNLQDSVELRIIRADRSASLKNYQNAVGNYKEALSLAVSDTSCRIDPAELHDSISRYQSPSDYQRNENKVNALIAMGNFQGAISLLVTNNEGFKAGNLSRFGLKPIAAYEFILDKNNPYLTESAALFYHKTGQTGEAFRYLILLRDQGVDSKKVKSLQENLGHALAKADMAARPDENTTTGLLKYPVATDWFTVFRKSYSDARIRQK